MNLQGKFPKTDLEREFTKLFKVVCLTSPSQSMTSSVRNQSGMEAMK